jgi:hypothetical protein
MLEEHRRSQRRVALPGEAQVDTMINELTNNSQATCFCCGNNRVPTLYSFLIAAVIRVGPSLKQEADDIFMASTTRALHAKIPELVCFCEKM